jgi:hypothetical protein
MDVMEVTEFVPYNISRTMGRPPQISIPTPPRMDSAKLLLEPTDPLELLRDTAAMKSKK